MTPTRSSIKDFLPKKRVKSGTAHHIVVSLAVVKAFDGSILASSNFSFFDCYQLKTCIDCTRSKFSCDWCTLSVSVLYRWWLMEWLKILQSKCVPNSEDACQGEQLVNSIGVSLFSWVNNNLFEPLRFNICSDPVLLRDWAQNSVPVSQPRKVTFTWHRERNNGYPYGFTICRIKWEHSSANTLWKQRKKSMKNWRLVKATK
jgi:hypothetical protein